MKLLKQLKKGDAETIRRIRENKSKHEEINRFINASNGQEGASQKLTILELAILGDSADSKEVLEEVLQLPGLDVNHLDPEGDIPLNIALQRSKLGVEGVKMLLAHKDMKVNTQDRWKNTPLHVAIDQVDLGATKLLLAVDGIDINLKNSRRQPRGGVSTGDVTVLQMLENIPDKDSQRVAFQEAFDEIAKKPKAKPK